MASRMPVDAAADYFDRDFLVLTQSGPMCAALCLRSSPRCLCSTSSRSISCCTQANNRGFWVALTPVLFVLKRTIVKVDSFGFREVPEENPQRGEWIRIIYTQKCKIVSNWRQSLCDVNQANANNIKNKANLFHDIWLTISLKSQKPFQFNSID